MRRSETADNDAATVDILWPAPGVHLARLDEDIIVLDLGADAYNCLLGVADALALEHDGAIVAGDIALATDLVAAGIATDTAPALPRMAPVSPARELPRIATPSRIETLHAAIALALASRRFRDKSLVEMIAVDAPAAAPVVPNDEARLDRLVAAVRAARPWVPYEGECLQRSFQLRRFLADAGIATCWYFGVRTWPFAAHCWLQIDDLVLGDRLERVRFYAPILVV